MIFALSSTTIHKLLSSFLIVSSLLSLTEGHGYLQSPRSRALYASEEGKWWPLEAGNPPKESEPQSARTKQSYEVCGTIAGRNYDVWNDVNGSPMSWRPQEVYNQGQEIVIESSLTANHWGHFEIYLCPNGRNSNQDCMFQNPATFVQDLSFGAPADSRFPQRAYVGSNQERIYRHKFRLPEGVVGNEVLMQWRYVTANSCLPEGYRSNNELVSRGYVQTWLGNCSGINLTGEPRAFNEPEQFFSCAEIKIIGGGGSVPPPTTPRPPGNPSCGGGNRGNGMCPAVGECCSKWGWCGTTPEHCGPRNEVGTCGNGKRNNGKCPNSGDCCSKWGWCGRSIGHCNN